jgi:hypothetical protein
LKELASGQTDRVELAVESCRFMHHAETYAPNPFYLSRHTRAARERVMPPAVAGAISTV